MTPDYTTRHKTHGEFFPPTLQKAKALDFKMSFVCVLISSVFRCINNWIVGMTNALLSQLSHSDVQQMTTGLLCTISYILFILTPSIQVTSLRSWRQETVFCLCVLMDVTALSQFSLLLSATPTRLILYNFTQYQQKVRGPAFLYVDNQCGNCLSDHHKTSRANAFLLSAPGLNIR